MRPALALALLLVALPALALGQAQKPAAPGKPAQPAATQSKGKAAAPASAKDDKPATPPEVFYDASLLPDPVRRMRARILEAALSGEPDKLKIAIEANEVPPVFSFGEQGDPIEAMKEQSADGQGLETLAILAEVLEAGFVHVDRGTPQEMYVWPYFAEYPLDRLTPPQTIELFKIVTAAEHKEMKEFGAYNFFRVGIGPDGTWHFFVAGD